MIVYEKHFGAFNLLMRCYGSQWPRASMLAMPSAILAAILAYFLSPNGIVVGGQGKGGSGGHLFLHPYPYAVYSGVVAFILIFRTNLSYARYWEGRSMLAQMSSKWGDAAIQVISFDEGAEETAVAGGLRFRSEFIHTMSLMHALAVQRLRGDDDLDNLTFGSFIDIPGEPPVDAQEVEEWGRVRGAKSLVFLRAQPHHLAKYWRALPLSVLGGINPTERSILSPSFARVYLVMCWLHRALVARRMAGGISQDAPIVSRIYQVLSDGMLGYENALKIVTTPFPFPFAQCVALLLHINALLTPLLMADWVADVWMAALVTFLSVFSFYLLNEVAREIEEPFRFDPNDLPVVFLHHKFNERLVTAFVKSLFPRGGLFTHIDEAEMKTMLAVHRPLMVTVAACGSMDSDRTGGNGGDGNPVESTAPSFLSPFVPPTLCGHSKAAEGDGSGGVGAGGENGGDHFVLPASCFQGSCFEGSPKQQMDTVGMPLLPQTAVLPASAASASAAAEAAAGHLAAGVSASSAPTTPASGRPFRRSFATTPTIKLGGDVGIASCTLFVPWGTPAEAAAAGPAPGAGAMKAGGKNDLEVSPLSACLFSRGAPGAAQ